MRIRRFLFIRGLDISASYRCRKEKHVSENAARQLSLDFSRVVVLFHRTFKIEFCYLCERFSKLSFSSNCRIYAIYVVCGQQCNTFSCHCYFIFIFCSFELRIVPSNYYRSEYLITFCFI